jgi:hypothetical protein
MPDDFWKTIGAILGEMPPALAGLVVIAASVAVLVYSWRRATDEAKKERAKATDAGSALSDHKLDAILAAVTSTAEHVADIHTDLAVLRDRGRK